MNTELNGIQEHRDVAEATMATNRLSAAMDAAKDTYNRLQKKAVQGAKATDQAVHDHPYYAIGIAFGLGALAGFLWRRRQ